MARRINVTHTTNYDDPEDNVSTVAGWFDLDKATRYDENTHWDGNNMVSSAVADRYGRQILYRTAKGRWVLNNWSQWSGSVLTYEFIEPAAAREWLIAQEEDEAVEQYFGELEDERGPGRPEVGNAVHIRLGDLLAQLDEWAADHNMSRPDAMREAVRRLVSEQEIPEHDLPVRV